MCEDTQLLNNFRIENEICESCVKGKQSRLPFSKFKDMAYIKRPLFVINSDV